jgi:hypothetical protein
VSQGNCLGLEQIQVDAPADFTKAWIEHAVRAGYLEPHGKEWCITAKGRRYRADLIRRASTIVVGLPRDQRARKRSRP